MAVRSSTTTPRPGTRGEPEKTRAAILKAAVHEFASEGVAGARTDAIARAAGVNKALLYYYFKDKEALYGAVVDSIFEGLRDRLLTVPRLRSSATRKDHDLRGSALRLHRELAAFPACSAAGDDACRKEKVSAPEAGRAGLLCTGVRALVGIVSTGMESGDFRTVDTRGFIVCMVGSILHYFNTVPFAAAFGDRDPLSREAIAAQRAVVLDFVSHALMKEPQ